MKKLQYYSHPSVFFKNVFIGIMTTIILFGGWLVLQYMGGISLWFDSTMRDVISAFHGSIGLGIFVFLLYFTLPLGAFLFTFMMGFTIWNSIKNALFFNKNSIIIELDDKECVYYSPDGKIIIRYDEVKEFALFTDTYSSKGETCIINRVLYFHLKDGYEKIYTDTVQWDTEESYCIGIPLLGLSVGYLEIYKAIKDISHLPEVECPIIQ